MSGKYIDIENGVMTQKQAINSSAGAGDAAKIIRTNSAGKVDSTFLPPGVGETAKDIECSENLSAGNFINIYFDGSDTLVRKADASNGREAHGYVLSAFTSGQMAKCYFGGINDQVSLSGQTAGTVAYLSNSIAGGITHTAPSTSGHIVQRLGVMTETNGTGPYNAGGLLVNLMDPITLA